MNKFFIAERIMMKKQMLVFMIVFAFNTASASETPQNYTSIVVDKKEVENLLKDYPSLCQKFNNLYYRDCRKLRELHGSHYEEGACHETGQLYNDSHFINIRNRMDEIKRHDFIIVRERIEGFPETKHVYNRHEFIEKYSDGPNISGSYAYCSSIFRQYRSEMHERRKPVFIENDHQVLGYKNDEKR